MSARARLRLLVCLIPMLGSACLVPIEERPWVVVSSPNFEILSTMKPEASVALAEDLERFRALVFTTTRASRFESPVPTRITAFARMSEFAPYRPGPDVVGVFQPGLRENSVMLADYSKALTASEVIQHEYVHFVLDNGTSQSYPLWYEKALRSS